MTARFPRRRRRVKKKKRAAAFDATGSPRSSRVVRCHHAENLNTKRDTTKYPHETKAATLERAEARDVFSRAFAVTTRFTASARAERRVIVASPGDHPEALRCWNWMAYTGM